MRGYFGIGVERASKPMNLGNLFRTAHGFGARFVFTVDARLDFATTWADTSKTGENLPLYHYDSPATLQLPEKCQLVGIELTDEAIDLPSFRHPPIAAYILGGEALGLSSATLAKCCYVIKIPTKFSLNVATAGAIVLYDRIRSLGRHADRPFHTGGPNPADPALKGSQDRPRVLKQVQEREERLNKAWAEHEKS